MTANKRTYATCLLLPLVVVVFYCCSFCHGCDFPDYVQSRDGEVRRDWHGHVMRSVRNNARQYSTIASFHGGVMQTTVLGGSLAKDKPKAFKRECALSVGNSKFLAVHQNKNDDPRIHHYVCMQFIKRGNDVIQLRNSRISKVNDTSLCDDRELVLDDWPWFNRENLFHSYDKCPLKGGFKITVYDKSAAEGVCDAYDGDTRLESECVEGEGMYFRFRNKECVPNGIHMSRHQRVVCMASWEDHAYMYSVVRHASSEHLWCLRYPNSVVGGDPQSFSAYLFKDLYCDRRDFPPNWEYIRMDVIPDVHKSLESLCDDDYEACSYWANACNTPGSEEYLTCAKRCGICEDSRPSVCSLPTKFRGEWLESLGDTKNRVSIDDMYLTVESYTSLRCIEWQHDKHIPLIEADELSQMFVTTYDNGCRPRYSCAHLKKKSPSILRYKLSLSQIWPFDNVDVNRIDCNSFHFKDDDVPFGAAYRSKHHKTLISEAERVYVDCQFTGPKTFEVRFEDGVFCHGWLTQDGLRRTKLKLQLDNCLTHQAEQEFACLDSSHHGYRGDQLVVTETLDTFNRIRCFLFPMQPELTFYLLHTNHCHEGASKLIINERITPLATFSQPKPETSPSVRIAVEIEVDADENTPKDPDAQQSPGGAGGVDGNDNNMEAGGSYEIGENKGASGGRDSGGSTSRPFNTVWTCGLALYCAYCVICSLL